jgi:chromosome segregation ATPase
MKDKVNKAKETTKQTKVNQSIIPSVDSVRITSLETDGAIFSVELDELKEGLQSSVARLYRDYKDRIEQSTQKISWLDEKIDELSMHQSQQHSLVNQRIDKLYQELQLLSDARGLDIDMKKIVDGLEQTIHDLGVTCHYRCTDAASRIESYKRMLNIHIENAWANILEINQRNKFFNTWIIPCFTMALVSFVLTITNLIKQMFF